MGQNKRKKLIKLMILLLVLVIIITIIYFVTNIKMPNESKHKKVLLIGIDGMDPKIAKGLMEKDKLPNFKKLAETGSFMNLNAVYPPNSPVAWTSIATGMNPGKHNIFDFIRRDPKNYVPELSLSKTIDNGDFRTDYESYVKADPFWRITTKAEIPTTVIRWPITFPPERIQGNMLSGLGVPDIKGFLSGYTYYTSKKTDKSDKDSNKIVEVKENNGLIETEIFGPRTKKSGDIINIKTPMKIKISEDRKSVDIIVNDETYLVEINDWSDWIRAKFDIGMFKNVYGIFKAYLVSIEPFQMYITAIQIDPKNPVVGISYPEKYSADLVDDIGLYYTLGIPEETEGYIDGRISKQAFLKHIEQIEEDRSKMFWKEFNNFKNTKNGVFGFVFDTSDRIQHVFWEEKVLGENDGKLSLNKAVLDYYVKKDIFIGEVLKQLDDKTLLIIVSDHGFTSFERAVSINTWLYKNGYISLKKEITEKDDGALFRYVDWSKTKAYSLGFNSIYINLKGREKEGIIENKEEIVNEIIEKLESFVDEKTGKNVVHKAYKSEDIYSGNYVKNSPDIIIGFNPGYRMDWKTAIGGFDTEIVSDNLKKWDGDHLVDPVFVPGVLFSNIKIDRDSAHQVDIVPTVLDSLGLDVPSEIDGESLLK